ncbi:Phage late control D family protein [Sulfidibacter corallicola]|uniref:Phage late control D family protein n=1 Tax=Sulfidibacter corallicola TaxID=2818388 RepID=A0A8A4TIB3_SULCO|nr:hypothetical protein [Sulfidibacter corallicola]QTD49666.1 phage late control D family protein [Sulfidibacter corallicola]
MFPSYHQPTFHLTIEDEDLPAIVTEEITALTFEDAEGELDLLELTLANRNGQLTDHPLFQEGNAITIRFGYVDDLSPPKHCVIKDITYDFPESDAPRISVKAYDRGFQLSGKETQRVWTKPAPGILYSDIAETMAAENGLQALVAPTRVPHLRVVQSNQSDAVFLTELAKSARAQDGDGLTGYVFYVEDDVLHFHPPNHDTEPKAHFAYFTDGDSILRSFRAEIRAQGVKSRGTEIKTIGVDPREKKVVEHRASNQTAGDRPVLGERTYLVDGNTGEARFKPSESGHIQPAFARAEYLHKESAVKPEQAQAEGTFKQGEFLQVTATATTIGLPSLKAKQNVMITGVGEKLSGVYYCRTVRHQIDSNGYLCELTLRKNALGTGAGAKSEKAKGKQVGKVQPVPTPAGPDLIRVDANTGVVLGRGPR